nr:hypothetical protein [Tanacetum cinerariifolium]
MSTPKFADVHNLVTFLSKPTESKGFEQIIDFLNDNPIKYALTVNPTIYTLCVEQFWATATAKNINGEAQIHAKVDGKKVIISEATIRRDLKFEDEGGVDCLSNEVIFKQLPLMGSTMASAIICLATNQKFNISKYIFDSMTIADEPPNKEMYDSLERATTIAISLDAEQDRGNISKTQSKATPNEPGSLGTSSGGGPRRKTQWGIPLLRLDKLAEEKDQLIANENLAWDNVQAMMDAYYKLAARLHEKEQGELTIEKKSRLFVELMDKRKKHFAKLRAEEKRRKPLIKAQKRNQMLVKDKVVLTQESSSKRAGDKLDQGRSKKQKVEDNKESKELKWRKSFQMMEIISVLNEGSDKGKSIMVEDANTVKKAVDKDNESDPTQEINCTLYSDSDSEYSNKSVDYLSEDQDKLIKLRKRKSKAKNASKVRKQRTQPAKECTSSGVWKKKQYVVDDNETVGEKFVDVEQLKECMTYYALANGFSLWKIKSSVDDLVPIPRESEVTSICDDLECDMPITIPLPTTDVREEDFHINSPLGEQVVNFLMENGDLADLLRHLVEQFLSGPPESTLFIDEVALLVTPLLDSKDISLKKVENFDPFFSLTQSGGKMRVIKTPSFGFHHMSSPCPAAYSPKEVMYRFYHPYHTSGDGFDHESKSK